MAPTRRFEVGPPQLTEISLFLAFHSLFGSNISLFCFVGNLVETALHISVLSGRAGLAAANFHGNSLFFPYITGNSAETGSLQTAHATTQSLSNAANLSPRFGAAIAPCFPRIRP